MTEYENRILSTSTYITILNYHTDVMFIVSFCQIVMHCVKLATMQLAPELVHLQNGFPAFEVSLLNNCQYGFTEIRSGEYALMSAQLTNFRSKAIFSNSGCQNFFNISLPYMCNKLLAWTLFFFTVFHYFQD